MSSRVAQRHAAGSYDSCDSRVSASGRLITLVAALMIALARKSGRSAGFCRVCVDILVTVSGFLLGGQFGIGTVISALGLGSLINLNFSLLHFRPAEVHQENIAETLRYLRS